MKRLTTEEFINKSNKVHNGKYDYNLTNYNHSKTKVKIICPEHGEFEQVPANHLQGKGCNICKINNFKTPIKSFIDLASKVHNNKYTYTKVEYVNAHVKVKIICPIHGEFEQIPNAHLKGHGCKDCSYKNNKPQLKFNIKNKKFESQNSIKTEEFIRKAIKVHGNMYNYSLVEYIKSTAKVKIICPKHGGFEQVPMAHLKGQGCQQCGLTISGFKQRLTIEDFINKANKVHNNKYDYNLVKYFGMHSKIKIICSMHGIFEQLPKDHIHKKAGCPKCSHHVSSQELEICLFLDSLNTEYEQSDRSILNGKELDIVIPSKKLAIEFNGLYWHSASFKPIRYHREKYLGCKKEGYQLLSIFEPEWIFKKDIVKSIILAKLNIYETKIGARKCEIKQLVASEARPFFDENHIQGFSGGSHIGLFFENQLVSAISFRKNKDSFELTRFVNKKNTLVMGAFSKLLKYFINNNPFDSIYTFADLRYFEGSVYEKNGFEFVHEVAPSYYYFKGLELLHKMNFRHSKLKKKFENYNSELTEYQNCLNNGYDRIWDCGKIKYAIVDKLTWRKL